MKYRDSISVWSSVSLNEKKGPFRKGDVFVTNTNLRLIFNGQAWDYDRDLKVHQ